MKEESPAALEEDLKELLKRCPAGTYEAALQFRKNKDVVQIEIIVMGIIDRHLEPDQREILAKSDDTLRMYEDLGMDSLTMLEVVMLVEQTLQVSIDNEELRDLRTVGDVKAYLNAKAMGVEPPKRSKTFRIEEVASLMPHKDPFLFLESLTVEGDEVRGDYKITGNEYFLEGHFKEQPIFPASIMIEALGQLCVFYLLKGEHAGLTEKVDPKTIFFTSCDGVKCRRICQPGDKLSMKIRVSRVRHPLACFSGEINVGGEKTATAQEIKLAFDYFPVMDGQKQESSGSSQRVHANGNTPNENGKSSDESPRFVKFNG
ncbi:MAG: phosphopantetheine-binding protein [Opitutales bacterium]|nr:phosphopantetheine-binding protein [Opitutales bacterium]